MVLRFDEGLVELVSTLLHFALHIKPELLVLFEEEPLHILEQDKGGGCAA